MSLFTPQTNNKQMDEAYARLNEHVKRCKTFDEFLQHFMYIAKSQDPDVLNKWLLKVLYVLMRRENEHEFDRLLRLVDDTKKAEIRHWLESALAKFGGDK